ncbi:MAG: hypothetical protein ABR986_00525 [Methanomassiliicoccales archaeon]
MVVVDMTGTNNPDERIYANPPEPLIIKVFIGLALIFVLFGIFSAANGSLIGLFMCLVAGIIVVFIIWREFVHNPIEVSFGPNEMTLLFRYSKPLQMKYDDILWLALPFSGRIGGMKVKKRSSFEMNLAICLELKNRMNDESRMAPPGGI